jgi:ubiquinone/menaquinone biosynthesis C-methylase UbiE
MLRFLNWLESLYTGRIQGYGDEYFRKNHLRLLRSPLGFLPRRYHRYVARTCMVGEAVNPRGWRVLDVGCGVGILAAELLALGHDVTGIDVNEAAIRNSIAPSRCRLVADSGKLDFPDGHFDLVVSREVLEHIEASEIDRCIDEWDRVGKGRMVHIIAVTERGRSARNDPTHVNVQPERWWTETFRRHGYARRHCPGVFFSQYGSTGYFVLDKAC